jgi:hypothetical protein
MRQGQFSITSAEVHDFARVWLAPLLGTWPRVRHCTVSAVISVLAFAASRISSIADACARLRDAPDDDTVRKLLARQLPSPDQLDRRLRRAFTDHLPRALRRGRWIVAFDITLIPYHGRPFADDAEVYRGQPKSGTTHFHAYATAYLVRDGQRFTLALVWVRRGTSFDDIVRELRRRVRAAGVKMRLVLLDRGFHTSGVIRYFQAARQPFIMPQTVHGKTPAAGRPLHGLRAIRATQPTGWTSHTWKGTDQRRVHVDLCVVRRRRHDRRGHRVFLYACWGVHATPPWVRQVYRRRFGVETSFRQMNQARIRTTTRRPALRLLFVGVALLLRNLWAWLHWVALAKRQPGGRRVQLHRLRFRTLLLWLAHAAESLFLFLDITPAQAPPYEPVASHSPNRR